MIAAAALKCMGGEIQGRLWPRNEDRAPGRHRRRATTSTGCSTTDDLVAGDNCFFAVTGITDGEVLKGVHYDARGATTQSLVMRSKSGTVRLINARHQLDKLSQLRLRGVRLDGSDVDPVPGRSADEQSPAAADGALDAGEEHGVDDDADDEDDDHRRDQRRRSR